ncbi:MAG: phosphoribosylamine--glycine ligase [Saprospiraceae bacterium]|nr:phosphoribosylamine--glycine ligase [Saprospiraceae bacterium]
MNVLLLGSGGREHAFAWKINQSDRCKHLYIAPGNAGTAGIGTNVDLDLGDFEALGNFALEKEIDLVIVGPEKPLVGGLADYFRENEDLRHIKFFGPSRMGARLEGSKSFAKRFMEKRNIPTATYREFTQEEREEGLQYIARLHPPIVLKADGLAAGKGVLILDDVKQAQREFQAMLDGKFGAASERVVIETFLKGIEFSVFAVTDGREYRLLPVAKDYKRVGEGDSGPNTGGMGSISPPGFVEGELMQKVIDRIVKPTVEGLQEEDIPYRGFIFFGLINVGGDPYVIEYNCRMGDPETQVVLPRLKSDLLQLIEATFTGKLPQVAIEEEDLAAAAVVLVSGGYPGTYQKGKIITGLDKISDSIVFQAGTRKEDGTLLTNGGRVMAITSLAESLTEAIEKSNRCAELVQFEGKYFRRDIGFDL